MVIEKKTKGEQYHAQGNRTTHRRREASFLWLRERFSKKGEEKTTRKENKNFHFYNVHEIASLKEREKTQKSKKTFYFIAKEKKYC